MNAMKTKRNLILGIFVLLFSFVSVAKEYKADVSKSSIKWLGKKVTGKHNGVINLKSGSLKLSGDQIKGGEFIIDMNSIKDLDLKDATYNAKLVGHLKSDDFFGVATYPEAKLVITSATPFKNGEATVKGNLTIKGKTHPTQFNVKKTSGSFGVTIDIDRTLYGAKYGSGKFFDNLGDKMIDDIFTLTINLVLKK
jgi:polyisoprenoid-binding protein YceI